VNPPTLGVPVPALPDRNPVPALEDTRDLGRTALEEVAEIGHSTLEWSVLELQFFEAGVLRCFMRH
jgi:hypothetical protein